MGILSHRALQGLKAYKYKPAGYTWLDYAHTPMWNWLTERLPLWLAPNLITLIGLSALFLAYMVMWYYLPNYHGEAPGWAHYLCAFAVIWYMHLDCLDGKQARRTKSSSPLGQLFDHGCDALSLHFLMSNIHCTQNHNCDWTSTIVLGMVFLPWMTAHWEEYHTGTLLYGNGYFGILEANYVLAAVHMLTGLYSSNFWYKSINQFFPIQVGTAITLQHLFFAAVIIGGLSQIWGQLYRVFSFDVSTLPDEERGNKQLGHKWQLIHLIYIFVFLALSAVWTADSVLEHGQCRSVTLNTGVLYALVASKLIMDHMAKEPLTPPIWAYATLAVGAVNSRLHVVNDDMFSRILNVGVLSGYLWYVIGVVNEMAAFMGIKVFTIKPMKD